MSATWASRVNLAYSPRIYDGLLKSRQREDGAAAIRLRVNAGSRTALNRRAIEDAVHIKQSRVSVRAVRATLEAIEHIFLARRGDAEDRPATRGTRDYRACGTRSALVRGAVKHALYVGQVPPRGCAIVRGALEAVYGVELSGGA